MTNDDLFDRVHTEPVDRLTRICDAMSKAMQNHPEYKPTDKATVLLDNDEDHLGGIVFHGYDDIRDALIDMVMHLRYAFKANGITLDLVMVPNSPEGLDTGEEME